MTDINISIEAVEADLNTGGKSIVEGRRIVISMVWS
jgi:hypothetical protein